MQCVVQLREKWCPSCYLLGPLLRTRCVPKRAMRDPSLPSCCILNFERNTACFAVQRWANSVLRTEYKYEYYSSSKKWPNTNTNIIRLSKTDRIRIRILFGLPKMTEYEYEYYSAPQKRPNTNTNIIRLSKNDRIRIRILMDSLKTPIIFIFVLAQQCNIRGAFIHFSFWAAE